MKIYRLDLVKKQGFEYEQTVTTYHITKEVADAYAKREIEKGWQYVFHGPEDWGGMYEVRKKYYPNYNIYEIEVNEE